MDDILIFAQSREELEKYTQMVLETLREHDFYLKPEKCEFGVTIVDYLGAVISEGQISMDPKKVAGLKEWPTPTTTKQV